MRHPVDSYVNRLLRRRRPKPFAPTQDELAVMPTAIDLMAATPEAHGPRPAFVEQLRAQISEQERNEQGPGAARPAWRAPARRRFLAAGALTAAGAAAGVGADRMVVIASGDDQNGRPGQPGPGPGQPQPPAELTPTAGFGVTSRLVYRSRGGGCAPLRSRLGQRFPAARVRARTGGVRGLHPSGLPAQPRRRA